MECCQVQPPVLDGKGTIALVGNPNVGKSVLFHRLTGRYVTVSNYPGTTVELTSGLARALPDVTIVDTPGIVAFPPRTEDEAVTARVLFDQPMQAIVHVADAKNLRRSLMLAVQLVEMGRPYVLALNMMDEAQARGLGVDTAALAEALGATVVSTIATRNQGVEALVHAARQAAQPTSRLVYPRPVEDFLERHTVLLPQASIAPRAILLQWLSGDAVSEDWLRAHLPAADLAALELQRLALEAALEDAPGAVIQRVRQQAVTGLIERAHLAGAAQRMPFMQRLGRLTVHPVYGLPILALVLVGLYYFVGVFGAGTLVGVFEEQIFGQWINPWFTGLVQRFSPWPLLSDFIVGEYGIWTMGVTYAAALLLPIVTTFFIAFGTLEDSGYLPRLSVLSNRAFEKLGLNGRAVLPMVLGLGCVTMATITTRILESKRDRLLVILLLALAVPCSAQLGVVMGMLAGISAGAALLWGAVVVGILFAVGWLAARLLPGERSPLIVELPPLRVPVFSNVLMKTLVRLEWYVKEAVPLFFLGTAFLFVLDQTGLLPGLIRLGEPLVSGWLGLPAETSAVFLLGFLRRDFAATGLFAMQAAGRLTPEQTVVAITVITLFIPCIASLFMMVKERGARTTAAMAAFIFPFAFLFGGLLHRALLWLGW